VYSLKETSEQMENLNLSPANDSIPVIFSRLSIRKVFIVFILIWIALKLSTSVFLKLNPNDSKNFLNYFQYGFYFIDKTLYFAFAIYLIRSLKQDHISFKTALGEPVSLPVLKESIRVFMVSAVAVFLVAFLLLKTILICSVNFPGSKQYMSFFLLITFFSSLIQKLTSGNILVSTAGDTSWFLLGFNYLDLFVLRPFCIAIIFRLWIFNRLRYKFGSLKKAYIITLFLLSITQSGAFLEILGLGFVLILIYVYTKSLKLTIIFHSGYTLFSYFIYKFISKYFTKYVYLKSSFGDYGWILIFSIPVIVILIFSVYQSYQILKKSEPKLFGF